MYQPYIRGKQFELIGIRELAEPLLSKNKDKISPIIEPVRNSSTLKTTIKELAKNDINFTIIVNPLVGNFMDVDAIFEVIAESVGDYKNYQIGIIIHKNSDFERAISTLKRYTYLVPSLTLIHNESFPNITEILSKFKEDFIIKYNVINISATSRRYHRNFEESTRVELDDYFISQARNSDYLHVEESNFSEEHLYYNEEGFVGFSDFLTIGEEYSETGFLPYAVAIHLSYTDTANVIKVKHFVSNSNDDSTDVAGKFAEALNKLIEWCNANEYQTIAIDCFRDYHNNGHFPGLGTLKKLSLMHHIELVLRLI